MGLYDAWIVPRLTHLAMSQKSFAAYRARALAEARGRVLEIGIGSGLNLPFYGHQVQRIIGVDPSPTLVRIAEGSAQRGTIPVEIRIQSAESLPVEDGSIDTAVTTWSLCTIPDPVRALREVRRALAPGGRLVFVEHGLAPDPGVARWQNRLTPLWMRCAGGCHLNRPIDDLIRRAGFEFEDLRNGYMRSKRSLAFLYEGRAKPA